MSGPTNANSLALFAMLSPLALAFSLCLALSRPVATGRAALRLLPLAGLATIAVAIEVGEDHRVGLGELDVAEFLGGIAAGGAGLLRGASLGLSDVAFAGLGEGDEW